MPIDDAFRAEYDSAYNYMASRGHRVIGCAQKLLSGDRFPTNYGFSKNDLNYPTEGYTFAGLVSLEDPPKHGVREAIGTLRLAGIKVRCPRGFPSYLPDSTSHRSRLLPVIIRKLLKQPRARSTSSWATRRRR